MMQTKVVDERDSSEAMDSIFCINGALIDRKGDLFGLSVSSSRSACHVDVTKLIRNLHSAETRSRKAVGDLCLRDCQSFVFRTVVPSNIMSYSSYMSVNQVLSSCGLWTTSED